MKKRDLYMSRVKLSIRKVRGRVFFLSGPLEKRGPKQLHTSSEEGIGRLRRPRLAYPVERGRVVLKPHTLGNPWVAQATLFQKKIESLLGGADVRRSAAPDNLQFADVEGDGYTAKKKPLVDRKRVVTHAPPSIHTGGDVKA